MEQIHSVNSGSYVLEPPVQAFLDSWLTEGRSPLYELSFKEARQALIDLQADTIAKLPAQVEERVVQWRGKTISIRIVKPAGKLGALPALMYFHGGGWALGNAFTHDRLVRELAHGVNAAVVFVNYTPCPEVHYPTALEEAYAATEFVAEKGSEFGLDGLHLAVAGDGAGGNLAAAVTLLAKERAGPFIQFQLLFYPITDAQVGYASYQSFTRRHWLTRKALEQLWASYLPDQSVRNLPTVSPLKASLTELTGLPEALIITAEYDVLRDEGEAYAKRLHEAGVPTTATRYLGTIHDFVMLNALANTKATRAAISQAITSLKWAFAR